MLSKTFKIFLDIRYEQIGNSCFFCINRGDILVWWPV